MSVASQALPSSNRSAVSATNPYPSRTRRTIGLVSVGKRRAVSHCRRFIR